MTVGCVQLVKELTRLDNKLDVVLINTQILIQSISNCEPFGNSDHLSVKFAINLANSSHTVNSKSMHGEDSIYKLFRWKDANWPAFADFLNNVDWFDMLTVNLTADSLWYAFKRTINEAVELFVPFKLVTHKSNYRQGDVSTLITSSVSSLVSAVCGEIIGSHHRTM